MSTDIAGPCNPRTKEMRPEAAFEAAPVAA